MVMAIRTDMDGFSPGEVGILENHTYWICHQSLEKHQEQLVVTAPRPQLPHPELTGEDVIECELSNSDVRPTLKSCGDGFVDHWILSWYRGIYSRTEILHDSC